MAGESSYARRCIICALLLCLAGCAASPSTRFYTLHPAATPQVAAPASSGALSVYVKPVEIPEYLDRPQIVTRTGSNELHFAEYDRWGGPLTDEITAAVAEELGRQLGTERVFGNRALQGEKARYTVALRVLRLDCTPGKEVLLKAQWVVRDGTDAAVRGGTFTEPVGDRSYATLVEAIAKVLQQASAAIARDIPKETPNE